jgi:hypothetical protein
MLRDADFARRLSAACALLIALAALPLLASAEQARDHRASSEPETLGSPFEDYGLLDMRPDGCMQILTDSGRALLIENTGAFSDGDYVFVTGTLNESSSICPGETLPAIEANTIQDAYAGCGQLFQGPNTCLVFEATEADSFFIENSGGFAPGDFVYVRGVVEENSDVCAPFISTGLRNNDIGDCFTFCGVFLSDDGEGCVTFEVAVNGEIVAVESTGVFNVGDRVLVRGALEAPTTLCDGSVARAVRANVVRDECPGDFNGDNRISAADLAFLLAEWGPGPSEADITGDGVVDAADLGFLLGNWTSGA